MSVDALLDVIREHGDGPEAERLLAALLTGNERLRELLAYLLGQYDRAVGIHASVVMDTPEQRNLHDKAVAAMREAAEPVRAALAPQNHPRSAASDPEAPGQPGRGEEAAGGHTAALCIGCGWCCQSTPRERRGQAHKGCH